jgi:hypothetical protein
MELMKLSASLIEASISFISLATSVSIEASSLCNEALGVQIMLQVQYLIFESSQNRVYFFFGAFHGTDQLGIFLFSIP